MSSRLSRRRRFGYTDKIFVSETGTVGRLILPGRCTNFFSPLSFSRSPVAARSRDTISFYLLDPLHDPRLLRSPFSSAPSIQGLSASGRPTADKARESWRECTWTGRIRLQVDTGVTFFTSFSLWPPILPRRQQIFANFRLVCQAHRLFQRFALNTIIKNGIASYKKHKK